MKKKRRSRRKDKLLPYKEGALQGVVDFIKPLMKYRPPYLSRRDWLEVLFGTGEATPYTKKRTITKYVVEKSFQINGRLWMSDGRKREVREFRRIPAGTELFVRIDEEEAFKNQVDIEVVARNGIKSMVWEVTRFQWLRIKRSVELASDIRQ